MFGIHIDATNKTVELVEFDGGFDGMKRKLGIDIAEPVDLGNGVTMWLDEEGRLKSDQVWFKVENHQLPYAGSAMVVFGDYQRPHFLDMAILKKLVSFVDEVELTEDEIEPACGVITSAAELEDAIAKGLVDESMRGFFG